MEKLDIGKEKGSKGLFKKTWARCSLVSPRRRSPTTTGDYASSPKPKSPSNRRYQHKRRVAPVGCFSVYVGSDKERFVIKTEYLNHPLFKLLLDEAEKEYGYATEGPLELPCDVDFFERVLWEMEMEQQDEIASPGCNFAMVNTGYQLLSPSGRPSRFSPCRTPVVYPFSV